VHGGDWNYRSFDTISSVLLCNHNCWIFLEAFRQANELAFESNGTAVPAQWRECLGLIEEVFSSDDWESLLKENEELLKLIAPRAY
jgi:hypothetical protein